MRTLFTIQSSEKTVNLKLRKIFLKFELRSNNKRILRDSEEIHAASNRQPQINHARDQSIIKRRAKVRLHKDEYTRSLNNHSFWGS